MIIELPESENKTLGFEISGKVTIEERCFDHADLSTAWEWNKN
jgi:hypothetical protein